MGSFDIDYHKERLESYSGHKWMPAPSATDSIGANREILRAGKRLDLVRYTMRFSVFLAIAMLAGIGFVIAGMLGMVYLLFFIPVSVISVGLYFSLSLNNLEKYEDKLAFAEAHYQKVLEREIKEMGL